MAECVRETGWLHENAAEQHSAHIQHGTILLSLISNLQRL